MIRLQIHFRVVPVKVTHSNFTNYCYIALNQATRESVVVDPAWELGKIEATLSAYGASVRAILLTHSHHDHVSLADVLATRQGCPVYMSEEEARYYGFQCSNLRLIRSETPLRLGSLEIMPILTPGHTKGSVCYLVGDNLFTGDTLFAEGCGMCTGRGADPHALFDSLQKLKHKLSSKNKIFPGHSYGMPPGQFYSSLLERNIYLMLEDRSRFVSFRMRQNQTGLMAFK